MPVLLDLGCCPAGSAPERGVHERGGKAVVVAPGTVAALRHDEDADPEGWSHRVAGVLGLDAHVVAAGCPVPLAEHVVTWARVAQELDADRWGAVVVPVTAADAATLLEAPTVLLRALDARLDAAAGAVAEDAALGEQVAGLLALRAPLQALAGVAAAAAVAGHLEQHGHHRCRVAPLGTPTVDAADPTAAVRATVGVRPGSDHLVWWLALPTGTVPELHRQGDRLLVGADGRWRELVLPAALTRCTASAATVVGDRLEVRFTPDPDAWR